MRKGGVIVNDKAKIHCDNSTIDDHCIKFYNSDLSIPLKLNGTFSFIHSRKPTDEELQSCNKVFITPDSPCWNPYCKSFSLNEESMLDSNGEMADKSHYTNYLMDVDENDGVVASVAISEYEEAVDHVMMETFDHIPCDKAISDDDKLLDAISERAVVSKVMGTIGSVRTRGIPCNLFDDPIGGTIDELRELLSDVLDDEIIAKVEAIKVSNTHGVSKEFLSKIWVVSEDLAQGALDQNTQLCKHHANISLSRHFSTNDRML